MIADTARISISNIAWPTEADDEALALVRDLGFRGIELAPGKIFAHRDALDDARRYRAHVIDSGLDIVAFQAILFGDLDAALFGTADQQHTLAEHLGAIARLAGAAGAKACVFGAPKARLRNGNSAAVAFDRAAAFFDAIGSVYEAEGVVLAIEANAAHYGCDFLTHTDEAVELVKAIDRPGIRLQLDTGTLLLNDEPADVIAQAVSWTAHFHASEPDLLPIANDAHAQFGAKLASAGYDGWRSVEMRTSENWRQAIRDAAEIMGACYS